MTRKDVEDWGVRVKGCRVSFWCDGSVLKLMVAMAAQLCECTKNC